MSGKEVIRAAQMFTTTGVASRVSVVKEMVIATVLGIGAGMWWQVRRRQHEQMARSPAAGSRVVGSRPAPRSPCLSAWAGVQTYHWNESAKWENYYKALEEKAKSG